MQVLPLTVAVTTRLLERRRRPEALAEATARRIVADVRRRGDVAVDSWTRRLDGPEAAPAKLRVTPQVIARAQRAIGADFRRSLARAARNIRRVARRQMPQAWTVRVEPGVVTYDDTFFYEVLYSGVKSLRLDVLLAPAVVIGALLGCALARRIDQKLFDRLVLALTIVSAAYLLVE